MEEKPTSDPRGVDTVASYYDEWTQHYLKFFGHSLQAHRPTSESDLHHYLMQRSGLRDGKRALDAGCGVCGPGAYFAEHLDITIEALTISPVQAQLAAAHAAERGVGNRINVRVGDFHRLEELYPREEFDVVYFFESLSHSPEPSRVLAGAFAVLKPGGILYIKDYYIRRCADEDEQNRVLRVVRKVDSIFTTRSTYSKPLIAAVHAAGFLPLLVEPPRFQVDNTVWQAFENEHAFNLFEGVPLFDCWEWLELKFQKP